MVRRAGLTVWLLLAAGAPQPQAPAATADNLVLVTLDGARIEEMFGGLDVDVLRSTLRPGQTLESHPSYERFHAATPEERRARLMPFFWTELMVRHGSIAGNRRLNSTVTLTNAHRFSYPGYSEILLGEAHDDDISSNDRRHNPYVTVLEELRRHLNVPAAGVAAFGSWEVFNEIVEHTPGALTVNAGFEVFHHPEPDVQTLSRLQFETPTPWNSVRHDVYTFEFALAHLRAARPRVLYLALGETDDWAHDGRYDRVLDSFVRTDEYLRRLWTWLQSQPDYRDRTHLLITTDHGRGRSAADWRQHGAKIDGAQDVWMAFVSPRMPQRGEWRDHAPLFTNQAAATMAAWMGLNWAARRPGAGRPVAHP